MREAIQKHHDFYLNLKPEEIKEGDKAHVALAKQREADGDVNPLESSPQS